MFKAGGVRVRQQGNEAVRDGESGDCELVFRIVAYFSDRERWLRIKAMKRRGGEVGEWSDGSRHFHDASPGSVLYLRGTT
jgi:hypothetical protein